MWCFLFAWPTRRRLLTCWTRTRFRPSPRRSQTDCRSCAPGADYEVPRQNGGSIQEIDALGTAAVVVSVSGESLQRCNLQYVIFSKGGRRPCAAERCPCAPGPRVRIAAWHGGSADGSGSPGADRAG